MLFRRFFFVMLLGVIPACAPENYDPPGAMVWGTKGPARVVDGETYIIGEEHIRLAGIDACDLDQIIGEGDDIWACGIQARDAMWLAAENVDVRCYWSERDREGRALARCQVFGENMLFGHGEYIDAMMVRHGFAVVRRERDEEGALQAVIPELVALEEDAKRERLGLWAREFEGASDYRTGK